VRSIGKHGRSVAGDLIVGRQWQGARAERVENEFLMLTATII
jgi:hypothetical protein